MGKLKKLKKESMPLIQKFRLKLKKLKIGKMTLKKGMILILRHCGKSTNVQGRFSLLRIYLENKLNMLIRERVCKISKWNKFESGKSLD